MTTFIEDVPISRPAMIEEGFGMKRLVTKNVFEAIPKKP
jgi:hypothetical protein